MVSQTCLGSFRMLGKWGLIRLAAVLFAAGLISAILTFVLLRHGIVATSDSWAYWEGSVSIVERGTYSLLDGDKAGVRWWPPGFSIYLASVQAIFGTTGASLVLAMCLLAFMNSVTWVAFSYSCFLAGEVSKSESARPALAFLLGTLFVVIFVALCSVDLYANFLLLLLFGILLNLLLRIPGTRSWHYGALVVIISVTCCAALLTHNSSVAFCSAAGLVLLCEPSRPFYQRLSACCVCVLASVSFWVAVRIVLRQGSSHHFGTSAFSFPTYVYQSISGLGVFFLPFSFSFASKAANLALGSVIALFSVWGALAINDSTRYRERIPFIVVCVYYLSLLLLFNVIWVSDPMSGRFLWLIPLGLLPAVCILVSTKPAWCYLLLGLLLLGFPTFRFVRYARIGITNTNWADPVLVIRPSFLLTTNSSSVSSRFVRIKPPAFPWQARWADPDANKVSDEWLKVHQHFEPGTEPAHK